MSSNYPEGSMRGSGIYSQEVSYEGFDCDSKACGEYNEAGEVATDDWGDYAIECEFCGRVYKSSSISEDRRERHDY